MIIAVRPVTFPDYMENIAIAHNMQNGKPDYAGSLVVQCEDCGNDCYIGPRQQEKQSEGGHTVLCWGCLAEMSALRQSAGLSEFNIQSLGNTKEEHAGDQDV